MLYFQVLNISDMREQLNRIHQVLTLLPSLSSLIVIYHSAVQHIFFLPVHLLAILLLRLQDQNEIFDSYMLKLLFE